MNRDPVKDIHISSETKLSDLISQFGEAGGFVASKVSTATSIINDMILEEISVKIMDITTTIM